MFIYRVFQEQNDPFEFLVITYANVNEIFFHWPMPKNTLDVHVTETSTSRSERGYTTLGNSRQIFRVRHFATGWGFGTSITGDRPPAEANFVGLHSAFSVDAPNSPDLDLWRVDDSAEPRLQEPDQGHGRNAAARR